MLVQNRGFSNIDRKNVAEAQQMAIDCVPWLQIICCRGSVADDTIAFALPSYAQYIILFECYAHGLGVDQDVKQAVTLLQLSADKGYAAAQTDLASYSMLMTSLDGR